MIIEDILDVIGRYQPFVVENVLSTGETITYYATDFGYIAAASLLIISVYSVFRILGSAFGGRRK